MNHDLMAGVMGRVFGGPRVIVTTNMTSKRVQFRFPRCKSRRIHKKFKKREENFKIEYVTYKFRDPATFSDVLVIHPVVEEKLKQLTEVVLKEPRKEKTKQKVSPPVSRMDFGISILNKQSFINFSSLC